jgi:hypothetical protein
MKKKPKFRLPIFLFLLFSILKLTGALDWSWVWVTSPLWILGAFFFVIFLIVILIFIFGVSFGYTINEINDSIQLFAKKFDKK